MFAEAAADGRFVVESEEVLCGLCKWCLLRAVVAGLFRMMRSAALRCDAVPGIGVVAVSWSVLQAVVDGGVDRASVAESRCTGRFPMDHGTGGEDCLLRYL